jgi:hypothetical protein
LENLNGALLGVCSKMHTLDTGILAVSNVWERGGLVRIVDEMTIERSTTMVG